MAFKKGNIPWNKGIPQTEEAKIKNSESNKSKIPWNKGLTKEIDERVMNISKSHKGKILSTTTKLKISKSKKGCISWMFEKFHSEKTKLKISKSNKGQIPWNKDKQQLQTTGNKNPNWKGGKSKKYKQGYYSFEYKQWRKNVFERDNYICQNCGINKTYVTAHHIKSFAHYPKLRFEISNGLTLCEDCHKLTDNYKGRGI